MSSARLLVVDDDVAGLYALAEALRRRLPDVTVDTASSAERTLVLLGAARFDLVLTDFLMPGMDGLGLLRHIKAVQPDCTVFLMTGCDVGVRAEALRLGAAGFLQKPITPSEFVPLLRKALEQPSLPHPCETRIELSELARSVVRQDT
jgi:DNA-binding NtrC family response regulator